MGKSDLSLRIVSSLALLTAFLAGPLLGAILRGGFPASYLQFPPLTTKVNQSSFSWITFIVVLLFVIVTTRPFWKRMAGRSWSLRKDSDRKTLPWWGWMAAAGLI